MDKLTHEVLRHYQKICSAMEQEAGQYESGLARHFTGDRDDSSALAAELRHRARNMHTVAEAVSRLAE